MRHDHRPYWLKQTFLKLRNHYINCFIAPHLDYLGKHPSISKPRQLSIAGSGIRIGDFATIICESDQKVRIATWPSKSQTPHITIGNYCIISPGVRISAINKIHIGNNCMLANSAYITDSDWHGLHDRVNYTMNSKAVHINDNVWIGDHATVLKGVNIGENSIIAAGSIVTKDIPPNVIAAGNPAQIIKSLDTHQEFITRESLFTHPDYFAKQRYLDRYALGNNSFINWLRSMLFPSKKD